VFRACLTAAAGDLFHAVRLFELRHQLPNNYVMKVDKASMAASVEARAPYLDVRVANVALRTPQRFLLAQDTNKLLLRELARRRRLLPDDVTARPKFGGSIAANWITEAPDFRRFARAHVLAPRGWADALKLRDPMQRFFDHGQAGHPFPRALSIFEHLAWRLLLLTLWSQRLLGANAAEAWMAESS
jgi:asparagine synthase (glutamine-hydrolysing)